METKVQSTEEAEPPGTMPVVQDLAELVGIRTTIPPFTSFSRSVKKPASVPPKFPTSPRSEEFRARHFPLATPAEWCDWRWQLRNRVRSLEDLERMVRLTDDERTAIRRHTGSLPFAITPYYLSLLDPDNAEQPLRRTMIPVTDEYLHVPGEAEDPLAEDKDSPVPCIVHRYPDRVLFLVANSCASNCRYCTRSRMVENPDSNSIFFQSQWEQAIAYIDAHTEVRDVLLSGGDPLTLSDEKLDWLLSRLRRIPHVEFIRIGTKVPVVMPQRITASLTRVLKRFHPLWMSIHFTHPDELTPETVEACARLADAGIPLGSQTVLLVGHQRHRGDHEEAHARPAEGAREAVLPLPVRPDRRARATSGRRCRRDWRSSRACAVTPRGTRCRPTSSTPPGEAARSRFSPSTSSAVTGTTWSCATTRACSSATRIPLGAAKERAG